MTFEVFQRHIETHRARGTDRLVLPVHKRLSADLLTPVSAYIALREESDYSFLLESVEGGEKLARYSFLGCDPYRLVEARGQDVQIRDRSDDASEGYSATEISRDESANVFAVLQHLIDRYEEIKLPDLPRFTCGAVGYLGYDTVRLLEDLPAAPPDDLNLPDAVWCFYDTVVAFDHVRHQLLLMASAFIDPDTDLRDAYTQATDRLSHLETVLNRPVTPPAAVSLESREAQSNVDRSVYESAVEQAKRYIYEGDIFQVVLSQRFAMPFAGDTFNLYRALRQVNPSPYLFYLEIGDFALAGSSPEVLVRVEDERAEVLPIAGTRPRGADEEEDRRLAEELAADPKERAEHVMLVDLGRNDLGRVCRFDSVQVDRYAFVERYSHVMHIVSSVSGLLRPDCGPLDVLAACFPAGTVSGAPKVRAMEIIDELEPTRRGIYAGAVGYVDFSGNLDTCIAIRTMILRDCIAYVQAGAGIVADSDPAFEFEETVNKAQALHEAMQVASKELL